MILYYGYAYRDSYGQMPATEIKINQLLQQGKTENAFDLCEKTLEQAPASPHILILAANLAQKLGTKSSKELDSYYARFSLAFRPCTGWVMVVQKFLSS
ncbi:MAG: hypothetical protein ACLR8Y_01315 [Alistipes indistinctus]